MNIFNKFRSLLLPSEKRGAVILIGLMIIGMLLETLGIGLIVPIIGLLMQDDLANQYSLVASLYAYFDYPSQTQVIVAAMATLALVYAAKNLFLAFLGWKQARFAYGVQKQLSQRLFKIYLSQPYQFHLQRNSAQLIRNATVETNMLTVSISAFLLIMTETFVIAGIAILLICFEPLGAILVVSILAIAGFVFLKITRSRIARWGAARQHHDGMRIQHLQQGLGGVKDVLLLGRAENFLSQYAIHNAESARVAGQQIGLQHIPRLALEFLAVSGLAILVVVMLKQGGDINKILPTIGLFAAAAFRLLPSANRMLQSIQTVRFAIPIINLLHDELKLESQQKVDAISTELKLNQKLEVRNLSFSYPNTDKKALDDVSLEISKGASVGFIGSSGSGKSTLVDLILGLMPPSMGEIKVDGRNIHENIRDWQSQIGYVPQSIYLTDDTLRRNVAFGLPDDQINDEAVTRAIKAAQLDTFVATLESGLNTLVGERGVRLSGGQRQRIGIARALYHDPEILVLDEATSALDTETECDVMSAIEAMHGSKTIIIVAHRLSTVSNCDRLYQFEMGRLVNTKNAPKIHVVN